MRNKTSVNRKRLWRKAAFFLVAIVASSGLLKAQVEKPVKWNYSTEREGDTAYLIMTANIDSGWHVYSQYLESNEGPIPTSFGFTASDDYQLIGKVEEMSSVHQAYDHNFMMNVRYFEHQAVFKQKIAVLNPQKAFRIKGEREYMVCNNKKCLPPHLAQMEFNISPTAPNLSPEPVPMMGLTNDEHKENENTIFNPIRWHFSSEKTAENEYVAILKATLEPHWHLYSQHLPGTDGPVATFFEFDTTDYAMADSVLEMPYLTAYDPNFEMDLNFFENEAIFRQKVKVITTTDSLLKGWLEYMVCDDRRCLPPKIIDFEIDLNTGIGYDAANKALENAPVLEGVVPELPNVDIEHPLSGCTDSEELAKAGLWSTFLLGLAGGLFALLTPCVFPMIPLTVSFFTKGNQEKGKGTGRATLYGFFIFLIYVSLSIPFHFGSDPALLNEIATGVGLNIVFFIVFVVFAISFFGYFEISMPGKLQNKVDRKSNIGGVFGIFFMALTLALVSFSCTGPILGSVLGGVLKSGAWPITAAMAGFGMALGLPFAVFAAFPGLMNKLPSSGGWLNSVKVVLGFIELALAVKFLSNADLVKQWGFLHRETFLLLWILIGAGLTAYLFGWIKFPHDSPVRKLKPGRLGLAALCLAFTIYLVPGVLEKPWWNHNALAGFPPPKFYSWYDNNRIDQHKTDHENRDIIHGIRDFDEAFAEAQRQNKPLLIDFTGWACVNCRKMEDNVWPDSTIRPLIGEEFVLASLYVDDKVELPEEKQGVYAYMQQGDSVKKAITTIGSKWQTFQTQMFRNNSQPYYVLLSPDGYLLNKPVGYTPDVKEYRSFLECGLETNNKHMEGK